MARTPERIAKENTPSNRGFGIAWLLIAIGLGFHVADEAAHNFLSTYNPSVRAIRARFPFLPLPTFTFAVWLTLLIVGILLLLCLSPLAFRGSGWLRIVSLPLGIVVGVLNVSAAQSIFTGGCQVSSVHRCCCLPPSICSELAPAA